MKAMIFAAGLGTRLRPLTDNMPKAMVPVAGQPLLYHVIQKLKAAAYDQLVVNVHHFPDQIIGYLNSQDFGVDIKVSDERDALLETGGGISKARNLLLPCQEPFLLHNVDILSNLDLAWFRSQTQAESLATLLVSERDTRRYLLFDQDMRLVGWTDISTGEVRSPYPDLDPAKCRRYAFAGIHNLSPAIFQTFDALGMPARFPIMDFYLKACAQYPIYGVPARNLKLLDVGKPETLARAEEMISAL